MSLTTYRFCFRKAIQSSLLMRIWNLLVYHVEKFCSCFTKNADFSKLAEILLCNIFLQNCKCMHMSEAVRDRPREYASVFIEYAAANNLSSSTGCSLNVVFFWKILKYSGVSVCTHTRQVEHQRCR